LTRPPKPAPDEPLVTPWLLLIDSREQSPYDFQGLRADAKDGRRPLQVRTEVRGLPSGDYSIAGQEQWVAVERKSAADLFGTIGQHRERFERELARLNEMTFAAVVVEAEWSELLAHPPPRTKLLPKVVYRSVIAWQQRFPRVHWWAVAGRKMGEVTTFRILERFWRDRVDHNTQLR
jgi:DNA excision repair protein ERCC-4